MSGATQGISGVLHSAKPAGKAQEAKSATDVTADPFLTEYDLHLLREGTHYRSYDKLGAQLGVQGGTSGVHFAVWAPNAKQISVIGDFNGWNDHATPMRSRGDSGIWECFVPELRAGALYKYVLWSRDTGERSERADPYAFFSEQAPRTASIVWDTQAFQWNDSQWINERGSRANHQRPISIYEVHLGSWMRVPEEGNRFLSYRELAERLIPYVQEMGFTHVEFLPVMDHPFGGSWGYQVLSYFAPTSRYGNPHEFMALVDALHAHDIGVILDWVPAHFPSDPHGLAQFDGTYLYEHADPRKGHHPDWGTKIFNYGRNEVVNFLISSAVFWFERYHIDGLRVDAVASMLYLDYSRKEGEWVPNPHGGRENIEAIHFIRRANEIIYSRFPGVMVIAEESTSWPMVSRPTYVGGLGFGYKWNMGWMNDILYYMSKDPVHRPYHHNNLTFGLLYAFHENFILPFSHDEVVHGKGSLFGKMPGDDWQKIANLRLLYTFMYSQPGKKLLFMGDEIGQRREWDAESSVDWHLLRDDHPGAELHRGIKRCVSELNHLYRMQPALFELDFEPRGFLWVDCHDHLQSIVSFFRYSDRPEDAILCVFNFTPVPRYNYRLGVPHGGYWEELFNSDAVTYGGSGHGNFGGVTADEIPSHGNPYSLNLTLPPLSGVLLKRA